MLLLLGKGGRRSASSPGYWSVVPMATHAVLTNRVNSCRCYGGGAGVFRLFNPLVIVIFRFFGVHLFRFDRFLKFFRRILSRIKQDGTMLAGRKALEPLGPTVDHCMDLQFMG